MKGVFTLEPVESINTTKIETNANYSNIKLTSAEMGKTLGNLCR